MGLLWPNTSFAGPPSGLTRLQDTLVQVRGTSMRESHCQPQTRPCPSPQVCPDDKMKFFDCWSASSNSTSDVFADSWQSLLRSAGSRAPQSVSLLPDRYVGTAHELQPRGLAPGQSDPRRQLREERVASSCTLVHLFGGRKEFDDFRAGPTGGGGARVPLRVRCRGAKGTSLISTLG